MTIQRQYSLPNCKLVLEGLNNEALGDAGGRPSLSIVTNVECHFAGYEKPLTGGREFLESLATAASNYAQEYLSGIQHLIRRDRSLSSNRVQLERLNANRHRLTVLPEVANGSQPPEAGMVQLDLNTVQLFDLVEAIDQFYADAQTVPDLSLKLTSLPKRSVIAQKPVTKRALPATLGLSGLAVAALALFFVPAPEVRRPQPSSETTSQQDASTSSSPVATGTPASPPDTNATNSSAASSSSGTNGSSTATRSPGTSSAGVISSTEITDPEELRQLTGQLYDQLDRAWTSAPTFNEELIYRVGVNEDGEVKGYKYENNAALSYVNDIPLSKIRLSSASSSTSGSTDSSASNSTSGSGNASGTNNSEGTSEESGTSGTTNNTQEPLAQFRVVFKPDGVLEVSPWHGKPPTESTTDSESSANSESDSDSPSSPDQ